jgi:hypothetical protein
MSDRDFGIFLGITFTLLVLVVRWIYIRRQAARLKRGG